MQNRKSYRGVQKFTIIIIYSQVPVSLELSVNIANFHCVPNFYRFSRQMNFQLNNAVIISNKKQKHMCLGFMTKYYSILMN
jgi:hypothetical protein